MKILISGMFGSESWKHPFFEHISSALEKEGHEVVRYAANSRVSVKGEKLREKKWHRRVENVLCAPYQLIGKKKKIARKRVRPYLPWTMEYQKRKVPMNGIALAAKVFRPDLVIVISYCCYPTEVVEMARKQGREIKMIGWCVEGPWMPWTPEEECVKYDRYFCIHDHIQEPFRERIETLPAYALNKTDFHPLPNRQLKTRKIVFVGGCCDRRRAMLREIHDLPLEIWGPHGWDDDPLLAKCFRGKSIWGDELNALYNESEIVLDILSWNPSLSGVTQRVIDVPASGAFLLTDATKELRELFWIGDEVEGFCSPEDLRAKCLFYLENPERRAEIAEKGHRRALQFPDFSETAQRLIAPVKLQESVGLSR